MPQANSLAFEGKKHISIIKLGISQIYLNEDKISAVKKWFDPHDLRNFEPLPVHDFGNGKLTLTDGHSRAFVAYQTGVAKIPVIYDTDDIVTSGTGQMLYKNDIAWCERFGLNDIRDLERRIISNGEYQDLWIGRCDKAYNLLTETDEQQRKEWQALHPDMFLYGASEDLRRLYFESSDGKNMIFDLS